MNPTPMAKWIAPKAEIEKRIALLHKLFHVTFSESMDQFLEHSVDVWMPGATPVYSRACILCKAAL